MFLFQHRLRGEAGASPRLAQILIDEFFSDVDHSLRELGIGDIGRAEAHEEAGAHVLRPHRCLCRRAGARRPRRAGRGACPQIRPEAADWPEAGALAAYVAGRRPACWPARPSDDIRGGSGQLSCARDRHERRHPMRQDEDARARFPSGSMSPAAAKGHAGGHRGRRRAARGACRMRTAWSRSSAIAPNCWSRRGSATASRSRARSRPTSRRTAW